MGNPTHFFREINLMFQLVLESWIRSKSVMSWNTQKKKECIFWNVYFVQRKFLLTFVFYHNA